jgi:hypothetical protein
VAFKRYPRRAFLGFALFVGQAFLYNAVVFDLGSILHQFFAVGSGSVPYFMAIFAVSNFLGPLLLGRFFDTVGRIPMISGTYLGSAAIVAGLGVLLITGHLSRWEFMAMVLGAFFLASAGASAAYLTVSEVFPMETRALAIAFFFAIGTATGGIVGPLLFGQLIHSGNRHLVAIGFLIGAGVMAVGGIAELLFGVRAEQKSLENIAKPLTAEEAEALLPLPITPEAPPLPEAYHEQHEAVRSRELAEGERAAAAEHRAAVHALRGRVDAGDPEAANLLRPEELRAQISELRAQALDERASAHEERARAVQARSMVARRIAYERAAAAEERARSYEERAAALEAEGADAERHAILAESADYRAREREQKALAEEARAEAERLRGPAAELARARGEMHESWAAVHAARAAALEAKAERDERAAAEHEREAHDRELIALAADQRVDAAEHRLNIETLRAQDATLSQAEIQDRVRLRAVRDRDRERRVAVRFRPGPGDGARFYSPGMIGTAGTASRIAARAREQLDHEVETIARALHEHGPLEREELRRLIGARYWGPGRFRAALETALREGRVRRRSRSVFEPPPPGAGTDHPPVLEGDGSPPGVEPESRSSEPSRPPTGAS